MRISIALLILLSLQQMLKNKIFNRLPVLSLVLSSLRRMHAIKAINWHPQALTKHYIGRWHASQCCNSTVHNQLDHGLTFNPVPTLVRKSMNHLFDSTVLALCLTIGLRMVSSAKDSLHTHVTAKWFPECSCETSIMIVQNYSQYSTEPNPIFEKQLCNFRCSELPFPRPAGYYAQ